MEIDDTNMSGNEEVLSPTEITDGGANEQSVADSDAGASVPGGFSSKFAAARERAASDISDFADSTNGREASTKTSDEKVPEDEALPLESQDETEDENETEEEGANEQERSEKASRRGENFRAVVAERDTLRSANGELTGRLETFEKRFEKFGGFEAVETAIEVSAALSDPTRIREFNALVQKLPHRAAIQKNFFDTALMREENRVYGINRVLQQDFGLPAELTRKRMEKSFEFLVQNWSADPEEFEEFLDLELEIAKTPERELSRARAELERLKNPDAAKTENDAELQESEHDFLLRIQKTHDDFEDRAFESISGETAADYGLNPLKTDTPALREAKEFLLNAIKFAVGVEMRTGRAHETLLGYWIENQTENAFYNQAVKNYRTAMKTKVQNAFKQVSRLLQTRASIQKEIKSDNSMVRLADPKQSKNALPAKAEKKTDGGKEFRSAFSDARKTAMG